MKNQATKRPRLGPNPAEAITVTVAEANGDQNDQFNDKEVKQLRLRLQALVQDENANKSELELMIKKLDALSKKRRPNVGVTRAEMSDALGGLDSVRILLSRAAWPLLPTAVDLKRYRYVRERNRYYWERDAGAWEPLGTRTEMECHLRGRGCNRAKPRTSAAVISQVEVALELIREHYSVASISELPSPSGPPPSDPPAVRAFPMEVYYCPADMKYHWKSDVSSQWEPLDQRALAAVAACRGISSSREEGSNVSAFTRFISRIHAERTVETVAERSGYPAGVHEVKVDAGNVVRVLCPRGVRLPTAQPGEFPTILRMLRAVLDHDEHGETQVETFHLFAAEGRQAIAQQKRDRQAPGLAMIGVTGSGKSLVQNALIVPLLGGRTALAYPHLSGRADKNGDMAKAEILHCEDSSIRYTMDERSAFGQSIKAIVGNQTQRLRAMYQEATVQRPIWRLIITANVEQGYWRIMPPLDPTLEGKLSLLYAPSAQKTQALVAEVGGPEALAALVAAELPAYAHYLDTLAIPRARAHQRHRYTAFIHPRLRNLLQEDQPELALLDLMQARLFAGPGSRPWLGSATDLNHVLTSAGAESFSSGSSVTNTYEKLVGRNPYQLGRMLSELVESEGSGVTTTRSRSSGGGTPRKVYVIQPPSEEQWEALRHLRADRSALRGGTPEDFDSLELEDLPRDRESASTAVAPPARRGPR